MVSGMNRTGLERSLKRALTEALRDNREAVRDLLAEVIEDVAIANAIREGEKSKPVRRDLVVKALTGRR
jgi:hypothetical protein